MRQAAKTLGWTAAAVLALSAQAHAETLAEAIELAYSGNPDLQQARANSRSVDEGLVQARARYQPQLQLGLSGQYSKGPTTDLFGNALTEETNRGSATVVLTQPLYTGGLVKAQVRQATNDVEGQRQTLRSAEANLLFQVTSAYMDVLRDRQALEINRAALTAFSREVDEINARQRAGELTRTDVAQAQAQLQNQQAVVNTATAQLETSIAAYVTAVGQNPGTLEVPATLPGLPANIDEAFALAEQNSPSLATAQARARSAQTRVDQARASYLPKVSLEARYGYSGQLDPFDRDNYRYGLTGALTVTQPLFTGGVRSSQVRQTKADADASQGAVDSARRNVVQNTANAWNAMVTAGRNVDVATAAVEATTEGFRGMQIEYRADQRSTFELLNAESNLYAAQLALLNAKRDQYVASARLLGVVGRLEATSLIPELKAYDADAGSKRMTRWLVSPTGLLPAVLDTASLPATKAKAPAPVTISGRTPTLRPAVGLPAKDAPLTAKLPTKSGK